MLHFTNALPQVHLLADCPKINKCKLYNQKYKYIFILSRLRMHIYMYIYIYAGPTVWTKKKPDNNGQAHQHLLTHYTALHMYTYSRLFEQHALDCLIHQFNTLLTQQHVSLLTKNVQRITYITRTCRFVYKNIYIYN